MTRVIGTEIPAALQPLLAGADLAAREGLTILLLSAADGAWPHLALLSVGEVLAVGPVDLRVALWPDSTPVHNLEANGRATLSLIHDGVSYVLYCTARRGPDLSPSGGRSLARFDLHVEEAREDVASYAAITSGVNFKLLDPAAVLPRWERTIEALRAG
jgi:hypothetical protein